MEALKAAFKGEVLQSVESLISTSKDSFYFDAHRSDTVQQMNHLWKYSGTVLLYGDPGVGKSSLVKKAQEMLADDVVSLYIDGKVLSSADDILSFILDALALSGGPIKTRREAAEKLLQHAELEADLGRYVLVYIDHFDALRDTSQRFFWQLTQLAHNQLKTVFITDTYYVDCLEGFGVAETVPQLFLQPLHPHKIIHHLNERLAPSGLEMHQLLSAKALDQLVASARGNIAQLEDALQQLITQHKTPTSAKTSLSSTVVAVVALSLILTGGIYYVLVGGGEEASNMQDIANEVAPVSPELPVSLEAHAESPPEHVSPNDTEAVLASAANIALTSSIEVDPVTEAQNAVDEARPDTLPNNVVETMPVLATTPAPETSAAPPVVQPILPVTIQLMGVYERERLDAIVRSYPDQPLDIVQTERNGRPWFVLLYGAYNDKSAARRQISRIPSDLRPSEPWIRMREDIR